MKKIVGVLAIAILIGLVGCNTEEVSAEFFGETVVIANKESNEILDLVEKEIDEFESTLKNVENTIFEVKINGVYVEDYKNYDGDIETVEVDVYEEVVEVTEEKVDFEIEKKDDSSIPKGNSIIEVEGKEGLTVTRRVVRYLNGEKQEVISEEVINAQSYDPVKEVIRVGTGDVDGGDVTVFDSLDECEKEITKRNETDNVTYICIPVSNDKTKYELQILQ